MPRQFRLCILRIRHDTAYPLIGDDSCREFLFEAVDRSSPVQFWSDMTHGALDIQVDMLPWYDVSFPEAPLREPAANAAKQAARDAGHDLARFDGFAVLVQPGFVVRPNPKFGQPNEPETVRYYFDAGRIGDSAVLPVATSHHTFICHELGHVLDYDHTLGLLTPNPWHPTRALWPVYGDPYDIMSSDTFGGGRSTFSRSDLQAAVIGWPTYWPTADMWYSMGPGVARAQVRHRDPEALVGRSVVLVDTGAGWSGSFTLLSAGIPARPGTRLLVLRPKGSSLSTVDDPPGTYYLEYRGPHGWDRGLATGISAPAIVLHEKSDDGAGQQVIWYRGRIPIPVQLDPDLSTPAGDLSVRVNSVATDLSTVSVVLSAFVERRVSVGSDVKAISRTEIQHHSVTLALCGSQQYEMSRYAVIVQGTFTASYTGFGGNGLTDSIPRCHWTVGGKALEGPGFGYDMVPTVDGRAVKIFWSTDLDGRVLQFTNDPSDGTFELDVEVVVSEADGSHAVHSVPVRYFAEGLEDRYEQAYYDDLHECLRRLMSRLGYRPPIVLPPPGPGPDPGPARLEPVAAGQIR